MRLFTWLVMLATCCPVLAQEASVHELKKLQTEMADTRTAAAADPIIKIAAPIGCGAVEFSNRHRGVSGERSALCELMWLAADQP